ncbi:MAG: FAD-binding and (Fe-S)-binding domain-containing protein [Micrococcaceae bacterium]
MTTNISIDYPGLRDRKIDRLALAHDASHYLIVPDSVSTPETIDDIVDIFKIAQKNKQTIGFRSGGTSLSGQASINGILIDTRKNFRKIQVLDGGKRVRVEPGTTVRMTNAHLARHGYKLGPDPASEVACTIGGVVANNSTGMSCGTKYNSYSTVESMVVVLPSGTVINTADSDADTQLQSKEPELYDGLLKLRKKVLASEAGMEHIKNQYSMKNTMGYGLNSLVDFKEPVEILQHLMIGSEGTLGHIAEVTFNTIPVAKNVATALLVFPTLSDATGVLPKLVESGMATVELMDATSLKIAQTIKKVAPEISDIEVDKHAALLVEYHGFTPEELEEKLEANKEMIASLNLSIEATFTQDSMTQAALWKVRKGLYTTVAEARESGTTALLEDIVVPVPNLLETLEKLIGLFEKYEYKNSCIFGHAKDGNVHFLLSEKFTDPESLVRYQEFTDDMVELVLSQGGSLKAEHGTGRIMAPFVRSQFGEELYSIMWGIKNLFDPNKLLNPGVVLNDDPKSYMENLKLSPTVEEEVDRCVECGYCEPACPSKNLTLTPRQRIVVRRELARAEQNGDTETAEAIRKDYEYDGIQTCAVDGMCSVACPVNINTGDLVRRLRMEERGKVEQKAWQTTAKNWGAITNIGGKALSLAKFMPAPLVETVTKVGRAVISKDQLPMYDGGLPAGGKKRYERVRNKADAVYFQTCINTMFGPEDNGHGEKGIGSHEAFLRICERAGLTVTTPEGIEGLCCGTPWKSKGYSEGYDVMTEKVMRYLWDATNGGELAVVADASSCSEGLVVMASKAMAKDERYGKIKIIDSVEFIHEKGLKELNIKTPVESIAIHPTCSSTELGTTDMIKDIAEKMSDDVLVPLQFGCCAFAGDRGMLHPELTESATQAEAAEVTSREYAQYASSNRTCEIGMSRATNKPYRHILEILEEATR